MNRRFTHRFLPAAVAVLAVAGIATFVAIPSEAELARRAEQALGERLGVPVEIARLHWQLLPTPMIEVFDATTRQDEPVLIRHLAAWPRIGPLWRREIAFDRAVLDGANIPQLSLKAFKKSDGAKEKAAGEGFFHLGEQPLRQAEFRNLTWIGRRKISLDFNGRVDFDPQWRPREANVALDSAQPTARLVLKRMQGQDRYKADIDIASGTWSGFLAVAQPGADTYRITGTLEPKNVELRQLLETFKRKAVIAGRANGHTTLEAQGSALGEVVQSLQTRTVFSVSPATVLKFDLDRAIRTIGKEHQGDTRLQSLTGVLQTQNDPDGIVMRYSDLKAKSGALSASGTVVLQDRVIDADIAVDLVDGVVGVPLKITGPVADPKYSVPATAVAGAVAGTAVLPGVGTVIGARIGSAIGRIFGRDVEDKPATERKAPSGSPQSR